MSLILNIDTSFARASLHICKEGIILASLENEEQKEHASFLQAGIKKILAEQDLSLAELDAIAVANGPGSYTGLRVGLASAKGICYVTKKPLITIGTLPLMAKGALLELQKSSTVFPLLGPMIDARRMEVFTGLYNSSLIEVLPAQAKILNDQSFVDILLQHQVLFFGSGAAKFKAITNHTNALFAGSFDTYQAFAQLSYISYNRGEFTDLAYSEPLYLKEFFSGV